MAKENRSTPLIVEGESRKVIQMETKILHGTPSAKVAHSWRMEGRLGRFMEILNLGVAVLFNQIRRLGNKVADMLVNLGMETCRAIKSKDWSEVLDMMVRDNYIDLTHQDMMSIHETWREGGPRTSHVKEVVQTTGG